MNESGNNDARHAGPKPRLLSSKQTGVRITSEDHPDQQMNPLSDSSAVHVTNSKSNFSNLQTGQQDTQFSKYNEDAKQMRDLNGIQASDQNKMNITKEDLLRLLSMLKSELQSKEIALAAIKCEQLKRLINPVDISRSSLATTYMELQDRFKQRDQNNNKNRNAPTETQGPENANQRDSNQTSSSDIDTNQTKLGDFNNEDHDRESTNMLNTLLELLDRHPLLALPRDSIYCLDYNCNELSTKNYLNLKIQHLDNLINQHRRFRFYMNERLKRSEQRYLDLARELEAERKARIECEKSASKTGGNSVLLRHIDELKEALETEKSQKQAIVMTLLNDLLDEQKKNKSLTKRLNNFEHESTQLLEKENAENQHLLRIENEVNSLGAQLKKQSHLFETERFELQAKILELETENSNLKTKLERNITPKTSRVKSQDSKEGVAQGRNVSSSPNRSVANGAKHTMAGKLVSPPARNVNNSPGGKSTSSQPSGATPQARSSPTITSNSPTPISGPQLGKGFVISNSGSTQNPQSTVSTTLKSAASSIPSQKVSAPPVLPKLIGGNSFALQGQGDQTTPVRIQPLFKSASVSSTSHQVRNLKSSSGNGSPGANYPLARSSTSTNQSVTKPQVPAKPAQLLEQQRNSLN